MEKDELAEVDLEVIVIFKICDRLEVFGKAIKI
jgi:hypothetical protein